MLKYMQANNSLLYLIFWVVCIEYEYIQSASNIHNESLIDLIHILLFIILYNYINLFSIISTFRFEYMYKEHNGIYVTLCDKTHWIIIVFTLYTSLQNHSIVWIIMYCTVATSMVYCV